MQDIRDPLDQEFVLNRRVARKFYEKQLHDKMLMNRANNDAVREKK